MLALVKGSSIDTGRCRANHWEGRRMRDKKPLGEGWLRGEIVSAINQIAQKPYVSQGLKAQFSETANALGESDRLKKSEKDVRSANVAA